MKRFFILAMAAIGLLGCAKETDTPVVKFEQSCYIVPSNGGGIVIPVQSTGIDEVKITYHNSADEDVYHNKPEENEGEESNNLNNIPVGDWCKLIRVIEHYEEGEGSRALAQWQSGLQLEVEVNETGMERIAYITAESFTAKQTITIKQSY